MSKPNEWHIYLSLFESIVILLFLSVDIVINLVIGNGHETLRLFVCWVEWFCLVSKETETMGPVYFESHTSCTVQ